MLDAVCELLKLISRHFTEKHTDLHQIQRNWFDKKNMMREWQHTHITTHTHTHTHAQEMI